MTDGGDLSAVPARLLLVSRWLLLIALSAMTVVIGVYGALSMPADAVIYVVPLVTLIPGAIVLLRRDWHIVGWLLLLISPVMAIQLAEFTAELPAAWGGWLDGVVSVAFWSLLAALVIVFPDGLARQSRGQRLVGTALLVVTWSATAVAAFTDLVGESGPGWSDEGTGVLYDNPLGLGFVPHDLAALLQLVSMAVLAVATAALYARSRTATGATRQQFRWVLLPFAMVVVLVAVGLILSGFAPGLGENVWAPVVLAFLAIPICFAVAITRYRLYDIDRIVNRTVTYAILVGVIAVMFGAGAVWLPTRLPSGSSSLIVAATTLIVFLLFTPLRRLVQRFVDRRFNRTPYDVQEVADSISARLRDQVDPGAVGSEWVAVVAGTLHPTAIGLWVHDS